MYDPTIATDVHAYEVDSMTYDDGNSYPTESFSASIFGTL